MILAVETVSDSNVPGTLRFTYVRSQLTFRDPVFVWKDDDGFKHTVPVWR